MKPSLVVLAAGMGSRFGGLKQIEPIGPRGEWILDFSVYDALQANFGKVIFVIRREMEESFQVVRQRYQDKIEVAFAFQEMTDIPFEGGVSSERTKPWGTGHAVYAARHELNESFAVINADDFYGREAFESLGRFLGEDSVKELALVGYRLVNTLSENGLVSRGICIANETNHLIKVEEHTEIGYRDNHEGIQGLNTEKRLVNLGDDAIASMNCWGFPSSFLPHLETQLLTFIKEKGNEPKSEFYLPFAVDNLIQTNQARCSVLNCGAKWLGITHRDDLESVKREIAKLCENNGYPSSLW